MSSFLIDEIFPPTVAQLLRETYDHDAVHVFEIGLQAVEDSLVAATARAEGRAIVTENVVDFVAERDVVLLFVRKRQLPPGRAQGAALANILAEWAQSNPDPYLGPHWPDVG